MDGSMLYGFDQFATKYFGSWKGLILTMVSQSDWLLIDPGPKCDKPLELQLLRCVIIIFSSGYFYSFGCINLCLAISDFVDHILWRWNAYRQGLQSNGDSINHMVQDSLEERIGHFLDTLPWNRTGKDVSPDLRTLCHYPHISRLFPSSGEVPPSSTLSLGYDNDPKVVSMVSVQFRRIVLHLVLTKYSLKYESIDKSKNQIRLLGLDQTTTFGEIRCKLLKVS